ncbi:hypothetical protein D3H46_09205 [Streptococcus pyogenes]|nr:hypothetical protein D3H46_09205 [Streptococcus pyogenes]
MPTTVIFMLTSILKLFINLFFLRKGTSMIETLMSTLEMVRKKILVGLQSKMTLRNIKREIYQSLSVKMIV